MHQLRRKMKVPDTGEILLTLPAGFPRGEVEVIVLAASPDERRAGEEFDRWIDGWLASVPSAPVLPLSAFDRDEIYK